MTTYTLVYFQPSARGYDYTDGFLDSDSELSVETSDNYKDLVTRLAYLQFYIYKSNKNKPSYQLEQSELAYVLLVDGKDANDVDVEPAEFYASLWHLFDEYVKEDYNELVKEFDKGLQSKINADKQREAQRQRQERLRQYEELQKEFGK